MLGLAKRTKARILIASTSEVYGDPEVQNNYNDGLEMKHVLPGSSAAGVVLGKC